MLFIKNENIHLCLFNLIPNLNTNSISYYSFNFYPKNIRKNFKQLKNFLFVVVTRSLSFLIIILLAHL